MENYSVARWQPPKFSYDTLYYLGAYNTKGDRLHLQGRCVDPLDGYKTDLFRYYVSKWDDIKDWLTLLDGDDTLVSLNCWCPYSTSTKKQIKDHGFFACHTGLIGKLINKYRPDVTVYLDLDRHLRLVPEWKPNNYRLFEV